MGESVHAPDCLITYIAVQMPYELEANPTSPPIIQSQIVSGRSPAKPGETVVVYAWGLGNNDACCQDGQRHHSARTGDE